MTGWGVFLRGINLGKRQMKMAELKACLEEAGCSEVRTVLASGNVRLEAPGTEEDLRQRLEKAIEKRFGFAVGIVLRTAGELETMLSDHPFRALDPKADLTRHVLMFEYDLPKGIALTGWPGDTEILRVDRRDIYLATYRQPNGRYTEHVEEVLKPLYAALGKKGVDSMRNWNTIEKILK